MRFTVVWQRDAQDDLATHWLNACDRAAVTVAAARIDVELADDPSEKGQDLREGLRVFDAPPLRAIYDIREADCIVDVVRLSRLT